MFSLYSHVILGVVFTLHHVCERVARDAKTWLGHQECDSFPPDLHCAPRVHTANWPWDGTQLAEDSGDGGKGGGPSPDKNNKKL